MKSGKYVPEQGDLIWLDFNPQKEHEQRGKRPALVISPKIYNEKTSLCLCLPITSKVKGYPFEVALPKKLSIEGVILSDQVKNMDFNARNAQYICQVPSIVIQKVQQNIVSLIGL